MVILSETVNFKDRHCSTD